MDRRAFLKLFLGLPVLGSLLLFISPLFRYLKPTAGVFPHGLTSEPDAPQKVRAIEFSLSEFDKPWVAKEFLFEQRNPEYTRQGAQISRVPGFALRVPSASGSEYKFVVVSRICPHMGCIFNYIQDPHVCSEGYNYTPPNGTPMFGCPCHLSVYDPLQTETIDGKEVYGKVVSGPAPRPPRYFDYSVDPAAGKLVISSLESGGIA